MIKSMIAQGLILVDPGVDVAFGDKKYITWDSREGRPDMEAAEWYEAIALRFFPGRPKDFANSTQCKLDGEVWINQRCPWEGARSPYDLRPESVTVSMDRYLDTYKQLKVGDTLRLYGGYEIDFDVYNQFRDEIVYGISPGTDVPHELILVEGAKTLLGLSVGALTITALGF